MRASKRGAATVIASAVAVVTLAGCHSGAVVACPAVGHVTTLEVVLRGDVASVATVVVCSSGGCSPQAPFEPLDELQEKTGHHAFVVSADPLPTHATVRAVDADGRTLASRSAAIAWSRNKPGDACDLSVSTPPLSLEVGS